MHIKFRMLAFAGTLILASIASVAQTPHYNSLYVFGDSYSDVGNLYTFYSGHAPAPPYFEGRFSNGPIWVDHIAGFLNVPLVASSLGGTDYAWGAATVNGYDRFIPTIPKQVENYLSDHGGKADPNALFMLQGGINDVLRANLDNTDEVGFQIAQGLANCEKQLRLAGARHFLISDVVDVGLLPAAAHFAVSASAASAATNQWLTILLATEERREGIHILEVDVFRLVRSIAKAPTHFGFTNVTDGCLTTTLCADPDHWFFFDNYHPSEFAQADFAVAVETILASRDRD